MIKGTVNQFSSEQGFGFIVPEGGSIDLSVHHSEIQSGGQSASLSDGQSVKFEVGEGENCPCEINVKEAYRCSHKDARACFEACVVNMRPAIGSDLPKSSEENAYFLPVKRGTPSSLSTTLWRYHFCCFRSVFGDV